MQLWEVQRLLQECRGRRGHCVPVMSGQASRRRKRVIWAPEWIGCHLTGRGPHQPKTWMHRAVTEWMPEGRFWLNRLVRRCGKPSLICLRCRSSSCPSSHPGYWSSGYPSPHPQASPWSAEDLGGIWERVPTSLTETLGQWDTGWNTHAERREGRWRERHTPWGKAKNMRRERGEDSHTVKNVTTD